ncbi:MAG: hypothetical protein IIY77_06405 [Lachnospiraceae bacterium]|nr:hypothetical protein [Lachnospiraceae bacterium]
MNKSRFAEVFGGEGRVALSDAPEIRFIKALAAGDEEAAAALFDNEKQFGGTSAVDTPHGRYEGLDGIKECVRTWYSFFKAEKGEVEVVTQTRGGCRSALEFVFHFYFSDGSEKAVPMALAADLRDGLKRLDEVRTYMNVKWFPEYPQYRKPIFKEKETHELRTEMTSGVMPYYFNLVHNKGMDNIPDLMTRTGQVVHGGYEPGEIRVLDAEEMQKEAAERRKERNFYTGFPLKEFVGLQMETIIDDGRICCVEWEQVITKRGREERHRLSEPGISFYERAEDGFLKSYRIIDYAYTEENIDWEKAPISREEAEKINYLG